MSRIPNHNIDELEKKIGYKFKNPGKMSLSP
jgi:hypothetical protein